MAKITLSIHGAGPIRRVLSPAHAQQVVRAVLEELVRGALLIEGAAKRKAPVDMGRLRASITHSDLEREGTTLALRIGTNASYAKFVEFGTGPAGAASPLSESAREAMSELGYEHGAHGGWPPADELLAWALRKSGLRQAAHDDPEGLVFALQRAIRRRGTPAQPFLFPAFEEHRGPIMKNLETAFVRALEAT